MARVPMISRTMKITVCKILAINVQLKQPFEDTVTLPRTYKEKSKLEKAVKSMVDTDEVKFVSIIDTNTAETLYGMSEADFIKHSQVLDKETRKPIV